ncbi:MAG: hypothetical protein Kow0037_30290 [Calditrichia bacterium]
MTIVWDKIKKNLIDSLSVALDKTEELTSVGRIKLEILHLEQRLDEKLAALGKQILTKWEDAGEILEKDDILKNLKEEIDKLQEELHQKEAELGRIKKEDGIEFDS